MNQCLRFDPCLYVFYLWPILILAFGNFCHIHAMNLPVAAMLDYRPSFTNAQSANSLDYLTSCKVTGGSMRPRYSTSTTADFGFFGSSRDSDFTAIKPTTADVPPEWYTKTRSPGCIPRI